MNWPLQKKFTPLLPLMAVLSLAACVTQPTRTDPPSPQATEGTPAATRATTAPQAKPQSKPQVAQAPRTQAAANAPRAQLAAPATPGPQAADEYSRILEEQLLCSPKGVVPVKALQKKFQAAGLIPLQYRLAPGAGTEDGKLFKVNGNLTAFGYRVNELVFTGPDNDVGSGIEAFLPESAYEGVRKVFVAKRFKLHKTNGAVGYWADRPHGQTTGFVKIEGRLSVGCGIPLH